LDCELESCLLFSSGLLSNPAGLSITPDDIQDASNEKDEGIGAPGSSANTTLCSNVKVLPGGVRDAWIALSDVTRPLIPSTSTNEEEGGGGGGGDRSGNNALEDEMEWEASITATNTSNSNNPLAQYHPEEESYLLQSNGQLAQATRTAALYASLERAHVSATELETLWKRDAKLFGLAAQAFATSNEDVEGDVDGTDGVWKEAVMESFYDKMKDIGEYHARHDSTNPLLLEQQHSSSLLQNVSEMDISSSSNAAPLPFQRKKRHRHGDPSSDGYDLKSIITTSTQNVRSLGGNVYTLEEVYGKYLDLSGIYETHVRNMKHVFDASSLLNSMTTTTTTKEEEEKSSIIPQVDFLRLLSTSTLLHAIAEGPKLKERKKYIRFLSSLESYLREFLKKTNPFLNVDTEVIATSLVEFEKEWSECGGIAGYEDESGTVKGGWEYRPIEKVLAKVINPSTTTTDESASTNDTTNGTTTATDDNNSNRINLKDYKTAQELETKLDADVLKIELTLRGMKCGGTKTERAKRLFMARDVTSLDELPRKLFVKKKKVQEEKKEEDIMIIAPINFKEDDATFAERRVDIARLEWIVTSLLDQVRPTLDATARRAERRLTQTRNEREKELEEEINGPRGSGVKGSGVEGGLNKKKKKRKVKDGEEGEDNDDDDDDDDTDSEDEEEDAPIYNPKGVPLGWDGKPIPYWLFKLHGLNHFFPCEICGNESYRGRWNFEKHFTESKHAYGMRCLGIPNTKHFHGVTKIQDAQNLWAELRKSVEGDLFDGVKEEEYEDSHGNVLNRAQYEDLARQGLL